MTEPATAVPPAFPVARGCPFHPPKEYADIAAESPVSKVTLPTGATAWLVTGHELVRQVLNEPRVSVDRLAPGYPRLTELNPQAAALMGKINNTLVGLDPPEHTVHRRMLINEFTVKRVQRLRPRVQQIVDECIDRLVEAGPGVDLVQALSLPVPSLVICELLGVPYEDHDVFQKSTSTAFDRQRTLEERSGAVLELLVYVDKLVKAEEEKPGEGLVGRLITRYREAGSYDRDHMVGLGMLLLMAGHETTANMISLGTLSLMENPSELAAIRSDPELVPNAVEEALRFWSIVDVTSGSRVALDDFEVGGQLIRKGEGVIALISGANRDGSFFPGPEDFDIRRGGRHHVGFGFGIHQCLGQNLARMELEIAYRTLFDRIPDLRPAVPVDDLEFKDDSSMYGVLSLPVTWGGK